MLSLNFGESRFQVRAAGIVIHDEYLLLHRPKFDEFWTLPGGRVEISENAAAAVEREFLEELAVPVRCGNLLLLVENFFTFNGSPNHEIGLYFAVSLSEDAALLAKNQVYAGVEAHKNLEFRWVHLSDLAVTDLRPQFLRESLNQPALRFQHVVHRS